jgi:hypothetical protein
MAAKGEPVAGSGAAGGGGQTSLPLVAPDGGERVSLPLVAADGGGRLPRAPCCN